MTHMGNAVVRDPDHPDTLGDPNALNIKDHRKRRLTKTREPQIGSPKNELVT
jgi:hypothetical protein